MKSVEFTCKYKEYFILIYTVFARTQLPIERSSDANGYGYAHEQ